MKANAKMRNKLIPAIAMLAVSAVTLTTASYAWFTMSKTAEVTGIELSATTTGSLLVAIGTAKTDDTTKNLSVDAPTWTKDTYASFFSPKQELTKEYFLMKGTEKLIPASSYDGVSFFEPVSIGAAGSPVINETEFQKVTAKAGQGNDGSYVDVTLWFMTTGDQTLDVALDMANSKFAVKTGENTNLFKAARVAILNEAGGAAPDSKPGPFVLATTGYATSHVVINEGVYTTAPENTATAKAPKYLGTEAGGLSEALFSVPAATVADDGTLSVFAAKAITLRIWLEGQDTSCVNVNANQLFRFDLKFAVKETATP